MNNLVKGAIAGFVATIVLSALMVIKGMMGLMPELNVIAMLAGMMKTGATMAWLAHFILGAIVWGVGFAVLQGSIPGGNSIVKGIVFGIGVWVMMMVAVMPMAGAGMFGMNLGMMAPVMTLMLHVIFGAVLGGVYGKLSSPQPVVA